MQKRGAVTLLADTASKLVTDSDVDFPPSLLFEVHTFEAYVREWTSVAIGRMLLSRPLEWWRADRGSFNALIAALVADVRERVRGRAAAGSVARAVESRLKEWGVLIPRSPGADASP